MTKNTAKIYDYSTFIVPPSTVSKIDVSRLVHEVEWIDSELTTKSVHFKVGIRKHIEPVLSEQLADFLEQNNIELMELASRDRSSLVKQLRLLKDKVPVIHMTFATTADSESLQKLSAWIRESIHPQAVITVGLQPSLVAGVYMRTPNHVHDFSLRSKLEASHGVLVKELEALHG
jgi:F0F1-type ATP synthase delta subunit